MNMEEEEESMIEAIIEGAKFILDQDRKELIRLSRPLKGGQVLDRYQRDMALAVLESESCTAIIRRLIAARREPDVEDVIRDIYREESDHTPAIFLLGQAVKLRSSASKL
ncbi:hypothetical protein [Desulfogranum mediterraneum]|uniref:hypothetical protein n=1 Tax=Desulfogranum mediterraneum TaxID=160661 RepID=UPI0003F63020|nr:hypothetical protein [Desulfogranum mediterraneum]